MLKRIIIDGELQVPKQTDPQLILSWANSIMRIKAHGYSARNLGWITGIHFMKIWKWQFDDLDLMADELRSIARVLGIKMRIHEH